MAGILPFIAFLSLWLAIGNAGERLRWRWAFLRATLIWGAFAVALTEGLSLAKAVAPTSLQVGWGAVAVAAFGTLVARRLRGGGLALPRFSLPPWSS